MRRRWWGIVVPLVALAACGGGGGPSEEAALAEALAADGGGDLGDDQAECVARDVLELIGDEALEELDDAGSITDADLDDLGLDAEDDDGEEAEDVAEVFDGCDVDLDDVDVDDLQGLGGDVVGLALHAAYVDGVEEVLERTDDLDDLERGELACLARAVVLGVEVEALFEAGTPDDVGDADELSDLELDAAREIDDIAEVAADCDVDLADLAEPVLEEFSFGFGDIDCILDSLEPTTVDRLGVVVLVLGEDAALVDPEPISDLIDEISDTLIDCEPDFEEELELPEFDAEEYIDAVEEALVGDPGHPIGVDAAACIASEWVRTLGADALLEEAGFFPEDLADLDTYGDLFFLDDEAEVLVEATEACAVPVADLALALLDTAPVAPEQATCFVGLLADPVVAGDFVVGHLTAELAIDDPVSLAVSGALNGCGIAG